MQISGPDLDLLKENLHFNEPGLKSMHFNRPGLSNLNSNFFLIEKYNQKNSSLYVIEIVMKQTPVCEHNPG